MGVVKPERLVYKHVPDKDTEPLQHVVRTDGAEEGAKQTLGRLAAHLATLK